MQESEIDAALSIEAAAATLEASLSDIWMSFVLHLPQLLAGAVVLLSAGMITWLLRRLVVRILRRTMLRRSLQELFARLIYIGLWVLGFLLTAMIVFPGLTPTKALGGLGVASIAIGFAFKDIFENFFAGVLILWRFPFDNGDFVECGGLVGKVEQITIRNTLIRRSTGELVVVPNSRLFTQPVEVLTDNGARRVSILCGVAYREKLKEAIRVIRSAVERCTTPLPGTSVEVYANKLAASGVDVEVTWWTKPEPGQIRQSRNEVICAVKRAMDAAGIEIPFPHRSLVFPEALRVERSTTRSKSNGLGLTPNLPG